MNLYFTVDIYGSIYQIYRIHVFRSHKELVYSGINFALEMSAPSPFHN